MLQFKVSVSRSRVGGTTAAHYDTPAMELPAAVPLKKFVAVKNATEQV